MCMSKPRVAAPPEIPPPIPPPAPPEPLKVELDPEEESEGLRKRRRDRMGTRSLQIPLSVGGASRVGAGLGIK